MKTAWLSGLKGAEIDNFKQNLADATIVLDKLREIVYNRVKDVRSVSIADYDCPSWPYRQAHQNGQVSALEEVLALLKLDK